MGTKTSVMLAAALLVLLSFLTVSLADAGWERGYYRQDGTYVQPHYRTYPDGNPYNNYGYPGNYNPNTGRITPGNPDTYLKHYYDRPQGGSYGIPRTYKPYRY